MNSSCSCDNGVYVIERIEFTECVVWFVRQLQRVLQMQQPKRVPSAKTRRESCRRSEHADRDLRRRSQSLPSCHGGNGSHRPRIVLVNSSSGQNGPNHNSSSLSKLKFGNRESTLAVSKRISGFIFLFFLYGFILILSYDVEKKII